jgi:hypothetical protein
MNVQLGEVYRNERAAFDVRLIAENPPYRDHTGEYRVRVEWRWDPPLPWRLFGRATTPAVGAAMVAELLASATTPDGS